METKQRNVEEEVREQHEGIEPNHVEKAKFESEPRKM